MLSYFTRKSIMPLLAILLFLSVPNLSLAHTGFQDSNPKNGEIVTTDLTKIALNFEGKVENLSTFQLLTKDNQKVELGEIKIAEKTMTGTLLTPLSNGEYQVQWTIVGADGHPIKGQYTFTVNRPTNGKTESSPLKEEEVKKNTAEQQADNPKSKASSSASPNNEGNPEPIKKSVGSTSYILPAILVVAGLLFIFVKRRK